MLKVLKLADTFFKVAQEVWWNDPVDETKGAALPDSFWIKFVQMCKRLEVSPFEMAAVLNNESGLKASARNFASGKDKPPVAQGLNQLIKHTAVKGYGMSEELWKRFYKLSAEDQLPWVEKYFKGRAGGKNAGQLYLLNFGGFNNPDGSLYASLEAQKAYKAQHPDAEFPRSSYQQKAIEQNPGLVDASGRIMPSAVTSLVKSGVPDGIRAKIEASLKATEGKPVPGFQEPDPNPKNLAATPRTPAPLAQAPAAATPAASGSEEDALLRMFWS
jgi:hypothetical protein